MRAPSIFQKVCPACGAVVSTDIQRCDCGYFFSSATGDAPLPEEQALQEEELFEAYLAARVDQMVDNLESARAELAADPANQGKAARLLHILQEALKLREERDAQTAKTEQARQAAIEARARILPSPAEASAPEIPAQSAEPTEAFRAQQAAKAAKITQAFANTQTKECPHCKTVLPVTSALCLCGYIFARDEFMLPRGADTVLRTEPPRSK